MLLTRKTLKEYWKEPDNSLIKQYKALLKTENVNLEFSEDGIDKLAEISAEVNSSVENIGARRLHTIIEKVLDDISFNATDRAGETITVDKKFVQENLGNLVKDTDLQNLFYRFLVLSILRLRRHLSLASSKDKIYLLNSSSELIYWKENFSFPRSLET